MWTYRMTPWPRQAQVKRNNKQCLWWSRRVTQAVRKYEVMFFRTASSIWQSHSQDRCTHALPAAPLNRAAVSVSGVLSGKPLNLQADRTMIRDRDRGQQPFVPHVKPPEGAPSEDEDDLAAKTESCFLVFFPPQWGQTCFFAASEMETSLSKFRPQSLHLNS